MRRMRISLTKTDFTAKSEDIPPNGLDYTMRRMTPTEYALTALTGGQAEKSDYDAERTDDTVEAFGESTEVGHTLTAS